MKKMIFIFAAVILLAVTFPLWNPQKLVMMSQLQKLQDPSTHDRAYSALTSQTNKAALELLVDALVSKKSGAADGAREVLAGIGEPAVPILIEKYVQTKDIDLEYAIPEVLISIGEPGIPQLVSLLNVNTLGTSKIQKVNEVFQNIGKPAIEPLLKAAATGSDSQKIQAVNILFNGYCVHQEAMIGPILVCNEPDGDLRPRVVALLVDLAEDPNNAVRVVTVGSLFHLSWMGEDRNAMLITALSDPVLFVREKAVDAFKWIEEPDAIEPLAALLQEEDLGIQREAILALAFQGIAGVNAITEAYGESVLTEAAQNYEVLIKQGDANQVPVMMAALFHADADASQIALAYLNCGQGYLKAAGMHWAHLHDLLIESTTNSLGPLPQWGGK